MILSLQKFCFILHEYLQTNFANKNKELKDNLENMYTNYLLTCTYYDRLISVEDTGRWMQQKIKTGKAVGFDGIYLFIIGFYILATCANTS